MRVADVLQRLAVQGTVQPVGGEGTALLTTVAVQYDERAAAIAQARRGTSQGLTTPLDLMFKGRCS